MNLFEEVSYLQKCLIFIQVEMLALTVAMAYQAPWIWYTVHGLIITALLLWVFIRGLCWCWTKFAAYGAHIRGVRLSMLPESIRPDSDWQTRKIHPSTLAIVCREGESRSVIGTAIVIDGFLITAAHVVVGGVYPELFAISREYDDHGVVTKKSYALPGSFDKKWCKLADDLIACKAPQGIKAMPVESFSCNKYVAVQAAFETDNTSCGTLKHSQDRFFGAVEYSGSTRPGFSGAPYFSGEKILGIHLGGGNAGNYGVSASYVKALVSRIVKPEARRPTDLKGADSEFEALSRMMDHALEKDIKYDRGLDETHVEVGGRFFILENEDFDRLVADRYEDWFENRDGNERVYKQRRRWSYGEEQEKFNYEQENGIELEADHEPATSFLGESHPSGSEPVGSQNHTDCPSTTTKSTPNLQTSQTMDINGLLEQVNNLSTAFTSMRALEEQRWNNLTHQVHQNMDSLFRQYVMQTRQMESRTENPPFRATPNSTNTSTNASKASDPRVPQDSVNGQNGQQSVMRWATMDSDFQTFLEWRSSKNRSLPDYGFLRDQFLVETLKLTPQQAMAIVRRTNNYLTKQKRRLRRTQLAQAGQATR